MQKHDQGKIKSARKYLTGTYVSAALFFVGAGAIALLPVLLYQPPTNMLKLSKASYGLEIASEEGARAKGLSNRESLNSNAGMLFVLPKPEQACFWMKDMKFSIDIIWVNEQKNIVHLAEKVSPKSFPKRFCSPSLAKYVVELPPGAIQQNGLKIGQKLPLK